MADRIIDSDYLAGFFKPRHGKRLQAQVDTHYTAETLRYATPANRADVITNQIKSLYGDYPFLMVEVCAGIGGNTISFLDAGIEAVVSYEIDPERRRMLVANVNAYELGDRSYIKGAFDGPALPIGCALYFDPPWMPDTVSGVGGTVEELKANYYTKDIPVAGRTIEEWLEYYRGVVFAFATQIPLVAVVAPVEGWDLREDILTNASGVAKSKLIYGVCTDLTTDIVVANNCGLNAAATLIGDTPPTSTIKKPIVTPAKLPTATVIVASATPAKLPPPAVLAATPAKLPVVSVVPPMAATPAILPTSIGKVSVLPIGGGNATVVTRPVPVRVTMAPPAPAGGAIPGQGPVVPLKPPTVVALPISAPPAKGILAPVQKTTASVVQLNPHLGNVNPVGPPSRLNVQNDRSEPSLAGRTETAWDQACAALPVNVFSPVTQEKEWIQGFQRYIYAILTWVIPNEAVRNVMVSSKYMGTWIQAFTAKSWNPNKNYESLETLGDACMAAGFVKYIYGRDQTAGKEITPAQITGLKAAHLSKINQSTIAAKMRMDTWVLRRHDGTRTVDLQEDLLESFSGALEVVSQALYDAYLLEGNYEMALQTQAGMAVYRFVTLLFTFTTIDSRAELGAPWTMVLEYVNALGMMPKAIIMQDRDDISTVVLSPQAVAIFKDYGAIIPAKIVGSRGRMVEESRNLAAKAALDVFASQNVGFEWMRQESARAYVDEVAYADAITKAKQRGFTKLRFNYQPDNTVLLAGLQREQPPTVLTPIMPTAQAAIDAFMIAP